MKDKDSLQKHNHNIIITPKKGNNYYQFRPNSKTYINIPSHRYTLQPFQTEVYSVSDKHRLFEPRDNPVPKIQLSLLLDWLPLGKDIHHHFPDEDGEAQRVARSLRVMVKAQALEPDRAV